MLTIERATDIFRNVNGTSFIGLDSETIVPLRGGRRNPMKDRIAKRMNGASVMVFQNKTGSAYARMVERRLIAEGMDVAWQVSPRKWGERIPETPLVQHEVDGELRHYLEVIFLKPGSVTWWQYEGAGRQGECLEITREDAYGYGYRDSVVKPESQGGLHNKVIIRDYLLESILGLRIDGAVIQLRP